MHVRTRGTLKIDVIEAHVMRQSGIRTGALSMEHGGYISPDLTGGNASYVAYVAYVAYVLPTFCLASGIDGSQNPIEGAIQGCSDRVGHDH